MKTSARRLVTSGALLVATLAAWTAANGQPASGSSPPSAGAVAPIFAGAPPPIAPPVELARRPGTLHEREDRLDAFLDSGLHDGSIDKTVGADARLELDSIRYTEDRVRRSHAGGLTDADAFALDARLQKVSDIIRGHTAGEP